MIVHRLFHRFGSDLGQTMAEYSVVLGLIVIVTLATFTQLGDAVENAIKTVTSVALK